MWLLLLILQLELLMGTMIFLVVLDLHHYPTCVLRWKM